MNNESRWIGQVDTPSMVIDLDVVRTNIAEMQRIANEGGKQLRPHMKTHKLPQIAKMQRDAGAVGITCAKLGEAEVMRAAGIESIFIAYPLIGESKIKRLAALAKTTHMRVCVDSVAVAEPMSATLQSEGAKVEAVIKIDTGQGRTGLKDATQIVELARRIRDLPALDFVGIYTHEGQVYNAVTEPENIPALAGDAAGQMRAHKHALTTAGIECPVVSVGSTMSAHHMAHEEGITELRPGAYIFNDVSTVTAGLVDVNRVAQSIVTTVVSRPDDQRAIVDGGSKSFCSDTSPYIDGQAVCRTRSDLKLLKFSEEHGWIRLDRPGPDPKVGDRLTFYPVHCCAAQNMWTEVVIVEGQKITGTWPVAARGLVQ
jgi:D-serine deaminase-like pyridoxal phosphate-dependent protein